MARKRNWIRRAGFVAVGVGTAAILSLVVAAGASISRTTDRVGSLAYVLTGTANAHREVEKMEVASRGNTAADTTEVIQRRSFMGQQLRLSVPGLTQRSDPNPEVGQMQSDLARLDAAIAANGHNPPLPELKAAITALEIDLKRIFDVEEFRYFGLNHRALVAKQHSESLLLLLAGLIAVAGAGLLVILRQSAKNDLRAKAEELAAALASLEIAQAERGELLEETVRAGERERTWIAAELHDGPIQALAALCFRLDRAEAKLRRGDSEAAAPLVVSTRNELGQEVAQLRRLMSELRPPALDEGGLAGATRDYVLGFVEQTGIDCATELNIAPGAISSEREVVIYRLVQEALTNVRRHAHATCVKLTVTATPGGAELLVIDNGTGFDVSDIAGYVRNSHYGLAGMRERAEATGGQFTVTSAPGAGVELRAWLPGGSENLKLSGDQTAA